MAIAFPVISYHMELIYVRLLCCKKASSIEDLIMSIISHDPYTWVQDMCVSILFIIICYRCFCFAWDSRFRIRRPFVPHKFDVCEFRQIDNALHIMLDCHMLLWWNYHFLNANFIYFQILLLIRCVYILLLMCLSDPKLIFAWWFFNVFVQLIPFIVDIILN